MSTLDTNVFPILNLKDFETTYQKIAITGLNPDDQEFYSNKMQLQRKLTSKYKQPILVLGEGVHQYAVAPNTIKIFPTEINLVRTVVQLEQTDELINLDFNRLEGDAIDIAIRYFHFLIQIALDRDQRLWQPGAGKAVFYKKPELSKDGVNCYLGFHLRPCQINPGHLGICIDPTFNYVESYPLPNHINRDNFSSRFKGKNCVYHFGDNWYEIKIAGLDDRIVSKHRFPVNGNMVSLLEYIKDNTKRPHSKELANLSEDSQVLYYFSGNSQKAVPSQLCYRILDTNSSKVRRFHSQTILNPDKRLNTSVRIARNIIDGLKLGEINISLRHSPFYTSKKVFKVPDLAFGNGVVLSMNSEDGKEKTTIDRLGRDRLRLLCDPSAGFHKFGNLDRQYIVLPQSILDTYGQTFIADLRRESSKFHFSNNEYEPEILSYDDSGRKNYVRQTNAILELFKEKNVLPGYALVMIHKIEGRKPRDEDYIAAAVVQELKHRYDITASIIHSELSMMAYSEDYDKKTGARTYICKGKYLGRLQGYLRNVFLNKVLLANWKWPFVISSRMNSDVTIGIDVKNNTCGFILVGNGGKNVSWFSKESNQREQLLRNQIKAHLLKILRQEQRSINVPINSIVIHRDGRAFPNEIAGVNDSISILKKEGTVSAGARCAILEISKFPMMRFRLYGKENGRITNPSVGSYHIIDDNEAYLCATGKEFPRRGTTNPLCVRKVYGNMQMIQCLEDLYSLTTLSWTRPEDCTRYPITTKLNDIYLSAEATKYDQDELEFGDEEMEEAG